MIKFVTKERLNPAQRDRKTSGRGRVCGGLYLRGGGGYSHCCTQQNEAPFIFLLIISRIRTISGRDHPNGKSCGCAWVIIPKNRAAGLTAAVARASAGALNYTPVARVTNLAQTMEAPQKEGLWFVCADMGGTTMYQLDLIGYESIGLVIGNEGTVWAGLSTQGEKCGFRPPFQLMKGDIDPFKCLRCGRRACV